MTRYHLTMTEDGLPMVMRGEIGGVGENVGRALTRKDGEDIAAELNRLDGEGGAALRERILSEVTDAIENSFEGKP